MKKNREIRKRLIRWYAGRRNGSLLGLFILIVGEFFLLRGMYPAAIAAGFIAMAALLLFVLLGSCVNLERKRLQQISELFLQEAEYPFWFSAEAVEFENRLELLQDLLHELGDRQFNQELLLVQARMRALQNQINPHFLYNTLDTIRGYALMQDCTEVAEMTEALATMFRYNIGKPDDMTTLQEELDNVKNYFLIQKYRFGDKFSLRLELDPEEESLKKYLLPRLSIQPLVENAIHHGLENKDGEGEVRIQAYRMDGKLVVRISDNGLGMNREALLSLREKLEKGTSFDIEPAKKRKSGIAIVNLNQRLKLAFGEEYGVSVSSLEQVGTFFTITVPAICQSETQR